MFVCCFGKQNVAVSLLSLKGHVFKWLFGIHYLTKGLELPALLLPRQWHTFGHIDQVYVRKWFKVWALSDRSSAQVANLGEGFKAHCSSNRSAQTQSADLQWKMVQKLFVIWEYRCPLGRRHDLFPLFNSYPLPHYSLLLLFLVTNE